MQSFVLVALALLISNASATVTGSPVSLTKRQSVPSIAGCESQCGAISTTEQNCISANSADAASCSCSSDFSNALQSCYSCAISAGALDAATANQALQGLATACSEEGHPFSSPPTVSGGSGASGSSGSSASATSASASGSSATPASGKKNGVVSVGAPHVAILAVLTGAAGLLASA